MKKITLLLFLILSIFSFGQIYNPVKWSFDSKKTGENEYELYLKASINKGWHMYSQHLPSDDGPIATSFVFNENDSFELIGKVAEPKPHKEYDPNFDMELTWFEHEVTFTQKVKIKKNIAVTGELEFMVCDASKCLPPEYVEFSFDLSKKSETKPTSSNESQSTTDQPENKSPPEEITGMDPFGGANNVGNSGGNILQPVKWSCEQRQISDNEYELHIIATIDKGWHIYSQELASEGGPPISTSFQFNPSDEFELIGKVREDEGLITKFDPVFEMELAYFEEKGVFTQQVKLKNETATISGELEFTVCDDEQCLAPEYVPFEFKIGKESSCKINEEQADAIPIDKKPCDENPYIVCNVDLNNPIGDCGEKREDYTLWGIFLLGILGGFIALLTPCVFPMIPLTVSFFTKGGQDKGKGTAQAITYGFFIMLIYLLLSLPFHLLPDMDPEILNQISTNTWLNLLFFLIFVVFAISFFGYFEIVLPSSWSTKMDSASSSVGGFVGIFLMAFTLAIVSFSCTGPILGSLLAGTLSSENAGAINFLGMDLQLVAVKLSIGMIGFGLALGLPFALFAMFPKWMQSLPQSGGWLNSVKVVLGFVEIALAVKFLSNADLVEQWGLLKRETFFVLWFLCTLGTVLYLLGKIKFPHDSPVNKFSFIKIGFIAAFTAFTIYLFPGIFGGQWWSHNLLSGFPPPKYYSYLKHEHEIKVFTDYQEGLAFAKENDMPVMIDFTGWACVNCRKMEDDVWVEKEVKKILNEKYVVISLYVDEKTTLPPEKQEAVVVPTGDGGTKIKKIRRVGDRWSTLETLTFASNTQPYYVLLTPDEYLLGNPVGYNYSRDVNNYIKYLNCGLDAFEKSKNIVRK